MYHFEKKNSKKFSSWSENVWGPRENVASGPAVALDKPEATSPVLADNYLCIELAKLHQHKYAHCGGQEAWQVKSEAVHFIER